MELKKWNYQKMKLYKNIPNVVGIVIETHYYHKNMNLLVSHVDST